MTCRTPGWASSTAFNRAEIRAAAEAQGVQIEKGDVVPFHTGWLNVADTDPQRFMAGVHEFLFVLGQPRFVGAVQAVINPVAIH